MLRTGGTLAAVVAAALLLSATASANTYKPTRFDDPAPGPCKPHNCSLRDAISAANAQAGRDTVMLRAGKTYTLSIAGTEDANAAGDLDVTSPLTIASSGGGPATIDANSVDRALQAFAPLTLSRIRVTGGSATIGGGIYALLSGGSLIVSHSIVASNHSSVGAAGIEDESTKNSTVSISHSRIKGNVGGDAGGLSEFGEASVRIDHSTFAINAALTNGPAGGGISMDGGPLRVLDSRIVHNASTGPGGGIAIFRRTLHVVRSTITRNSASPGSYGEAGGGIVNIGNGNKAKTVVLDSTVSANSTNYNGGGIGNVAEGGGTAILKVTNSTIADNQTTDFGGGIDSYVNGSGTASVALNAVTVAYNDADSDDDGFGKGGGLQNGSSGQVFRVANTLIARNSAPTGPDCNDNPFASLGHNLRTKKGGCHGFTGPGDLLTHQPRIGKLARNGGPTETIALLRGSPAIGHAGASSPGRDQRGVKRDSHPDIGAFER